MSSPPFVSYAQNREDVVLYRALGHISGGRYVEVGANDPIADSVTYAFYERGWSGIEALPGIPGRAGAAPVPVPGDERVHPVQVAGLGGLPPIRFPQRRLGHDTTFVPTTPYEGGVVNVRWFARRASLTRCTERGFNGAWR